METKRPTAEAAEEILGGYFPVLDHGFVALVDYMGTDQDIESAARVSYGAGTRRVSQTRGLVRYLQRHAHTTPSEMVEFKFHCSMPMFVARQWVRHRTASVNEYSARYSLLPLLFYEPEHAHFAHQSSVNNQGREADPAPVELHADAVGRWQELRQHAADTYGWLLAEDVARELARIDLPLSTYTQWYWKIDLHNLLHFLTLRVDDHAQWEIQEYGRVMAGMLARVAPIAYEAWLDYNVLGARLSHAERMALAKLLRVEDGGIGVRDGVSGLGRAELRELGLAPREIRELLAKIEAPDRPDFSLDLADMRSAEEMEEKMLAAVPEPERRTERQGVD
ncbi:MAG: FAD-dependent thymidylate synthase [Gammaproteobacteria bacterium]|nr:FAD-dependent thymidylate synthase [Gammaproteobacteria bacterium]